MTQPEDKEYEDGRTGKERKQMGSLGQERLVAQKTDSNGPLLR